MMVQTSSTSPSYLLGIVSIYFCIISCDSLAIRPSLVASTSNFNVKELTSSVEKENDGNENHIFHKVRRGGAIDDDAFLDAYVESLIADVSTDDNGDEDRDDDGVTIGGDDDKMQTIERGEGSDKFQLEQTEVVPEDNSKPKSKARKQRSQGQNHKRKRRKSASWQNDEKMAEHLNDNAVISDSGVIAMESEESRLSLEPGSNSDSEDEKAGKDLHTDVEDKDTQESQQNKSTKDGTNTTQFPHRQDIQQKPIERHVAPPNTLQRFLLSQGYIGRSLAALTIIISELVHRYIPELYSLIVHILHRFGPGPEDGRGGKYRDGSDGRRKTKGIHSQYAAFTSGAATVGGKKASSAQRKEMDQVALDKLKHVKGGVKSGKYAHLSTAFMVRYSLGQFAKEAKIFEEIMGESLDQKKIRRRNMDESEEGDFEDEESDVEGEEGDGSSDGETDEEEDWVVQALSDNKAGSLGYDAQDNDFISATVKPSVSVGTAGASVGIDLNIKIPGTKKKEPRPASFLEAARGSKISNSKRKDTRVKGSDKDGGGGVLGRLRAVGANSVSSRILGAYPGDALPIEKAANKDGLFDLATKYGYGDWSDDEGEDHDDDSDDDQQAFGGYSRRDRERDGDLGDDVPIKGRRRKRRSGSSSSSEKSAGKRRRRRSSTHRSKRRRSKDFSVSFDINLASSAKSQSMSTRRRKHRSFSHLQETRRQVPTEAQASRSKMNNEETTLETPHATKHNKDEDQSFCGKMAENDEGPKQDFVSSKSIGTSSSAVQSPMKPTKSFQNMMNQSSLRSSSSIDGDSMHDTRLLGGLQRNSGRRKREIRASKVQVPMRRVVRMQKKKETEQTKPTQSGKQQSNDDLRKSLLGSSQISPGAIQAPMKRTIQIQKKKEAIVDEN